METLDQAYLSDLVVKTRGGSSNAFAELFAATCKRLWVYAEALTGDADTAAELVTGSYVHALQTIDALARPELFLPWLCRILDYRAKESGIGAEEMEKAAGILMLPLTESQILLMLEYRGLSETETGDILNAGIATIRRYAKAGRRHLGETARLGGTAGSGENRRHAARTRGILPSKRPTAPEMTEMLETIFDETGRKPNTVPMEALSSYAVYRKERFSLQRTILAGAMALFLLLPILFVLPRFEVTHEAEGERGLPVYTVHVKTPLPVGSVTAKIRKHSLPVYEADAKTYTVEPTRNGDLVLRVELINRQAAESTEQVSDVDAHGPVLVRFEVTETSFTLFVEDEGIGVDYADIRAVGESGAEYSPDSFDAEAGSVTFSYPDEAWDVYIPDHIGNTLHLALTLE